MRTLIVSANREDMNMVTLPLGPALVAAAAREAGHEVEFLDLLQAPDKPASIRGAVARFRPELIGLSVRNVDDQRMEAPRLLLEDVRNTVSLLKECSGAPLVLGGAGYSLFPEAMLAYLGADMGIRGEGEAALPLLLDVLANKGALSSVPGLYLRGSGPQCPRRFESDLDRFPSPEPYLAAPPARDGVPIWMPLQTARGCPFKCSYCSTAAIEGAVKRMRSPERIVQDIQRFVERGFARFYFIDNTFNVPRSHAEAICRRLIDRGVETVWRCILFPGSLDAGLVSLMANAGCKEVSLGFESGSATVLRSLNKQFGPDEVRRASELLADHGIGRMGFLLLGAPGESRDGVMESLAFADSLGLESLRITRGIRIYPRTPLARIAVAENVISADDDLLVPKFYMAKGLDDWLSDVVEEWVKDRPHWIA